VLQSLEGALEDYTADLDFKLQLQAQTYYYQGNWEYKQGKLAESKTRYERAVSSIEALAKHTKQPISANVVLTLMEAYERLGSVHLQLSPQDSSKALHYYSESLELAVQVRGATNHFTTKLRVQMGDILRRQGKDSLAVPHLEEALKSLDCQSKISAGMYCISALSLSLSQISLKENEKALETLSLMEKALEGCKFASAFQFAQLHETKAQALQNLGRHTAALGSLHRALECG